HPCRPSFSGRTENHISADLRIRDSEKSKRALANICPDRANIPSAQLQEMAGTTGAAGKIPDALVFCLLLLK
ncbi:hypothetical protein, partial [Rhizobium sp. BK049]|uniref:hypothetical protein n=1 Tax=Rhizobium sp. BK049 TaxID=2587095 RepID=UPI001AEDF0E7